MISLILLFSAVTAFDSYVYLIYFNVFLLTIIYIGCGLSTINKDDDDDDDDESHNKQIRLLLPSVLLAFNPKKPPRQASQRRPVTYFLHWHWPVSSQSILLSVVPPMSHLQSENKIRRDNNNVIERTTRTILDK